MPVLRYRGWSPTARRLRSALVAAGFATAILFGTATAATATPAAPSATPTAAGTANTCPPNALCLFDGTDFTGDLFTVASAVPGGVCVSLVEHGWERRARSVMNTLSKTASMFHNDNCDGGPYGVPSGTSIANLGGFSPNSVWVPYPW